jgi:hypothetical protein
MLKIQSILHSKHNALVIKTNLFLLCRGITTVYSENHTEHRDTYCVSSVEFLILNLLVQYMQ